MRKKISLILVILCLSCTIQGFKLNNLKSEQFEENKEDQECNITNFEFRTYKYWSKSDILNRTCAKFNDKRTLLPNITWKVNSSVTYTMFDIQPAFTNQTLNQTSQAGSKNIIVIDNAFIQTSVKFKWMKTENGANRAAVNCVAQGRSEQIAIALEIKANSGTAEESLLSNMEFALGQLTLINVDQQLDVEQKQDIIKVLNWRGNDQLTVKKQIVQHINSILTSTLKQSINEQNKRTGEHFNYTWRNQIQWNVSVEYTFNLTRKPQLFYADKTGIYYGYETRIQNFNNHRCGPAVKTEPLFTDDPVQSIVSYTFYENLINAAMEMGYLDSNVSNWPGFQYTAKDAYQIINNTEQFPPDARVVCYCKGVPSKTKMNIERYYFPYYIIPNVTYACEVNITNKNVLNIDLNMKFIAEANTKSGTYDFPVHNFGFKYNLRIVPGFQMFNKPALDNIIYQNVNQIRQLFGSGFPFYSKMINPDLRAFDEGTILE